HEQAPLCRFDSRQRVEPALVAPETVPRVREIRDTAAAGIEPFLLERRKLHLEPPRPCDVVRAHCSDVPAPRFETGTPRRCEEAERLLVHDTETSVAPLPLMRNVTRRVTRAVVDDDDLELLVRLPRERPQRFVQVRLAVAHRHQNRYERRTQPAAGRPSIARSARSISSSSSAASSSRPSRYRS